MILTIVDRLAELLGAAKTGRTASADFGQCPAARYAREIERYSDADLIRRDRAVILAEIRAQRARTARAIRPVTSKSSTGERVSA